MEALTRQQNANTAAEDFAIRYGRKPNGTWTGSMPQEIRESVLEKLVALPANPSPEVVDKIVESVSKNWTRPPHCDECREYSDKIIDLGIGEATNEGGPYFQICEKCLKKALLLLKETL